MTASSHPPVCLLCFCLQSEMLRAACFHIEHNRGMGSVALTLLTEKKPFHLSRDIE